jgi:hypothetical protein
VSAPAERSLAELRAEAERVASLLLRAHGATRKRQLERKLERLKKRIGSAR